MASGRTYARVFNIDCAVDITVRYLVGTYTNNVILWQITRACRESDRSLLFRGWSRLCLHAASLSAAEGASVAAATASGTARAFAVEKRAIAATERDDASPTAVGVAVAEAVLKERAEEAGRAFEEHKRRQASRVVRYHGGT